jgi:anti-anti-sigma factor
MYTLLHYNRGAALVIALSGEYDLFTVPQVEPEIVSSIDGQPSVVFDFSTVRYMDSSVLAMLARMRRELGERMKVVAPAGGIPRRMLDITGFDQIMTISENIELALGEAKVD